MSNRVRHCKHICQGQIATTCSCISSSGYNTDLKTVRMQRPFLANITVYASFVVIALHFDAFHIIFLYFILPPSSLANYWRSLVKCWVWMQPNHKTQKVYCHIFNLGRLQSVHLLRYDRPLTTHKLVLCVLLHCYCQTMKCNQRINLISCLLVVFSFTDTSSGRVIKASNFTRRQSIVRRSAVYYYYVPLCSTSSLSMALVKCAKQS